MSYIGNQPTYGDTTSNFKILDDISSYTQTFDGSSASVVSLADDTLTFNNHRFITGQRVTYTHGGGTAIGGLTSGTAYYIIKNDQNTVKLALTLSDANNNNAINFNALGTGSAHTLNVAFDGINTKFKATYDNGTKALITRAAQLQISINGVIQQPQDTTTPANGYGFDVDAVIIFSVPPVNTDVFWGNVIANNFAAYDISDNVVDNFTGTGSQTVFNLSQNVPNSESLLVTIDGVVQYPSDATTSRAYSAIDQELIFTSAPGNGTVIQARHIGFAGAVTSNVTGFYGRTGNVTLTTQDNINVGNVNSSGIGSFGQLFVTGINTTGAAVSMGNVVAGIVTATRFVGDGALLTGVVSSKWRSNTAGISTQSSIGVNTTSVDTPALVGTGNSFQGIYVSNGMVIMDNTLNGNHYIGTNFNGLMAGPVSVGGTLTIDGVWVVV
jgi:hypothetical protein